VVCNLYWFGISSVFVELMAELVVLCKANNLYNSPFVPRLVVFGSKIFLK